jgi:hypothetical protein
VLSGERHPLADVLPEEFGCQRRQLLSRRLSDVLPSLVARNRQLIVYCARLELQGEEAREQLDIG